jgi:hypothetical protein
LIHVTIVTLTRNGENLATRESPSAPPQYVDPAALASLIVAIASLAWTVYIDLRKRTAKPSAEVVARTVRVTRRDQGQADAPDHIIEAVVTETIRAAADHGPVPPKLRRAAK